MYSMSKLIFEIEKYMLLNFVTFIQMGTFMPDF